MFEALRPLLTAPDKIAETNAEIAALAQQVATVTVHVSEPDALVTLDGVAMRGTGATRSGRVQAGSHRLSAVKPGFAAAEARIDAAGGATLERTLELTALALAGRLSVVEEHGQNAELVVDEVVIGRVPFQGAIAPGEHTLFLRGPGVLGSQPAQTTVRLNQVTTLTLALEELRAELHVVPSPRDAQVAIDGIVVGQGAWDGRLREGPHRLEITRRGFVPQSRTVDVHDSARVDVALERDLSSPEWASRIPSRIVLEVSSYGVVGAPFAGGSRESCSGACSAGLALGALVNARLTYQLRTGFGPYLQVGYLYMRSNVTSLGTRVTPVGLPDESGTIDDRTRVHSLPESLGVSLRRGERVPFTLSLGAGAIFGNASSFRSGTFAGTLGPYTVATDASAFFTYVFLEPSVRVGYPLSEHAELFADAGAMAAVALGDNPVWASSKAFHAGNNLATMSADRLVGAIVLLPRLGFGARSAF